MLGSILQDIGSLLGVGSSGRGPQGVPASDIGRGLIGFGVLIAALLAATFLKRVPEGAS